MSLQGIQTSPEYQDASLRRPYVINLQAEKADHKNLAMGRVRILKNGE